MSYPISEQTDRAIYYALKAQAVKGTIETGAGGVLIPFVSSPGIVQENSDVQSQISRSDLLTQLGDYGQGSAPFQLDSELIIGAHDIIDAAVMRSAFVAAATLSEAEIGPIASVSGATVTLTGGTVISGGLSIGDVVTPLTGWNAADIGERFVVVGATSTTVTFHKAPATSGAVASHTATRHKYCIDAETDCAFTVEEYFSNISASAVAEGLRFAEMSKTSPPNGMIARSWRGRGRRMIPLDSTTTPTSPALTSPTPQPGLALSSANKEIIVNGALLGKLSAFQYSYSRPDFLPPTSSPVPEDIGLGAVRITGQVTILKDSMTYEKEFIAQLKNFDIGILAQEPTVGAANPFALDYFPNCRWLQPRRSGAGRDGFTTVTLGFEAGVDERGGAFPKTMMKLVSSAA